MAMPSNPGPPPPNGLVGAILTVIFCCLPFGIVAIVKAAQVNSLWAAGQYQAAQDAADASRKWTTAGVITGLIGTVIYVILMATTNSSPTYY